MEKKLFDSELKVMELLWEHSTFSAKAIADELKTRVGWSKTTTYTVIKKCIEKGVIEREEPGFVCRALVTKEQTQQYETQELINKMYDGSADQLIASLLGNQKLSPETIERLRKLIAEKE